jgi:histidinol-phosphate phosphatase family protein
MLKKAVILAGGKGTRLAGVRNDIPKPMMPVAGKPLMEYLIDQCRDHGITDIWVTVNHLKDTIIDHFGDGSSFGVSLRYYEEEIPLGTVGGVKALEAELREDFLVLYGDVMVNMDIHRLYAFHGEKGSEATLVVHPNDHPYDSDLLALDDGDRVVDFHPKPHPEGFRYRNVVNAATYVFSPAIFKHLESGVKADFGKDIFPKIVHEMPVYGYNTSEYLKDMGTPDRLDKVTSDWESGKIEARNLHNKQKAIFLDRDGVINYDTDLIKDPDELKLYPFAAETIKKINRSGYLAVVITNQSVIARGLTTLEGLNEIHKKLETELGNAGAFVDAIYFCPHHPDGGFPGEVKEFKMACDCRKPKPGMLLKAAKRFNIDLSKSWMIGDSERDALAGRAAGVKTIGVKTGHGVKKASEFPDYFMGNMKEAVDFILDRPLDAHMTQIYEAFTKSKKRPFVIAIGGNSRAGKSTLAKHIQLGFEAKGEKVLLVSLDDWILPKKQRQHVVDVFYNFQLPKLQADLKAILKGQKVTAHGYRRHPARTELPTDYLLSGQSVIILEGIVALSTPELRALADLKVFKSIDEKLLKSRFTTFYNWKGYSPEAIEKLYAERKPTEYDIIAKDVTFADLRL